jgi:hypothetical protein
MPSKQVVSDEVRARALGMYAGTVGQVLNNPQRWLGSTRTPSLPACPPGSSMLFATAPSATSHPPRRTGPRSPTPSVPSGGFGGERWAPHSMVTAAGHP